MICKMCLFIILFPFDFAEDYTFIPILSTMSNGLVDKRENSLTS